MAGAHPRTDSGSSSSPPGANAGATRTNRRSCSINGPGWVGGEQN